MKRVIAWVLVLAAIAAAASAGYWFGHRGASAPDAPEGSPEAKAEEKPVAPVSVVAIRRAAITEQTTSYGTVVAPFSEVRVVSVPFESRITRVLVSPGQTVAANAPLVEVEGSTATSLAFEEARNAATAAERDLQLVRERFAQKLATNSELYLAENTLRTAQGRLQSLQQVGAAGPQQLKSEVAGLVSKVDVQVRQIVPAGTPLVEVAAQNQIEVRLGAEPADVSLLKPGQTVELHRVRDAGDVVIAGKIRLISQRVDPTTRLVDVLVSLPPGTGFMLDDFVAGQIIKASADSLVVAREAVLPDEKGDSLFTIADGKAVKHTVRIGLANDKEVQILGEGLKEGDLAVVVGNYELQDGMSVEVQSPQSHPATDSAATRGAAQ